jgi:hypothetical protein
MKLNLIKQKINGKRPDNFKKWDNLLKKLNPLAFMLSYLLYTNH